MEVERALADAFVMTLQILVLYRCLCEKRAASKLKLIDNLFSALLTFSSHSHFLIFSRHLSISISMEFYSWCKHHHHSISTRAKHTCRTTRTYSHSQAQAQAHAHGMDTFSSHNLIFCTDLFTIK